MSEASRQIPSTSRVKRIRDFSSGILKQLPKVVKMDENIRMNPAIRPAGRRLFGRDGDHFAHPAQFLNLAPAPRR